MAAVAALMVTAAERLIAVALPMPGSASIKYSAATMFCGAAGAAG